MVCSILSSEFVLGFPSWYSVMTFLHSDFRICTLLSITGFSLLVLRNEISTFRFQNLYSVFHYNIMKSLYTFVRICTPFFKRIYTQFFLLVLCYKIIIFRLMILYSVWIWIWICTRNFITGSQEINIFICHSSYSFSRYKNCCNFFSIALIDISGFKLCRCCWFIGPWKLKLPSKLIFRKLDCISLPTFLYRMTLIFIGRPPPPKINNLIFSLYMFSIDFPPFLMTSIQNGQRKMTQD